MRWFMGVVVVCAMAAHAEEVHRPSSVALRLSLLAGGGFVVPDRCSSCGGSTTSTASFAGAIELAAVLRSRTGEGYFANQLVWYPIFDSAPRYALSQPFIQQMLAVTAEVGFLGRVHERVLFGGGALAAFTIGEPVTTRRPSLIGFGFVVMPGLSMRVLVAIDKLEVHRVGLNLSVLARLSTPGIVAFPTLSYSATLPW